MIEVSHNVVKIRNQETDAFEAVPGLVLGYTGEAIEPVIRELSYLKDSNEIKKLIFDMTYPIGSIIHSTREGNPSTYLGYGEWTQIKDVFLLAAGETYAAGNTGGEAKHTLTIDEMPSHSHDSMLYANNTGTSTVPVGYSMLNTNTYTWASSGASEKNAGLFGKANNTGGDQPHNNMPPYKTVYIWERTA